MQLVRVNGPADRLKSLALGGLTSDESRIAYGRALDGFMSWLPASGYRFGREAVLAWRDLLCDQGLSPVTVNVHLVALRRLAREAASNGYLSFEASASIQDVPGVRRLGQRLGRWLSKAQAVELLQAPQDDTAKGLRDRALLSILVGCGLRRAEAAGLEVDQIQIREGRWLLVDVRGKGGRLRSVQVASWTYAAVTRWLERAQITEGPIFRALRRGGAVTQRAMTPRAIALVVAEHSGIVEPISPHDLRRTFAKLAHRGGAPLEQIQIALGHESIQTTERYLAVDQDLHDAPCDRLGISI